MTGTKKYRAEEIVGILKQYKAGTRHDQILKMHQQRFPSHKITLSGIKYVWNQFKDNPVYNQVFSSSEIAAVLGWKDAQQKDHESISDDDLVRFFEQVFPRHLWPAFVTEDEGIEYILACWSTLPQFSEQWLDPEIKFILDAKAGNDPPGKILEGFKSKWPRRNVCVSRIEYVIARYGPKPQLIHDQAKTSGDRVAFCSYQTRKSQGQKKRLKFMEVIGETQTNMVNDPEPSTRQLRDSSDSNFDMIILPSNQSLMRSSNSPARNEILNFMTYDTRESLHQGENEIQEQSRLSNYDYTNGMNVAQNYSRQDFATLGAMGENMRVTMAESDDLQQTHSSFQHSDGLLNSSGTYQIFSDYNLWNPPGQNAAIMNNSAANVLGTSKAPISENHDLSLILEDDLSLDEDTAWLNASCRSQTNPGYTPPVPKDTVRCYCTAIEGLHFNHDPAFSFPNIDTATSSNTGTTSSAPLNHYGNSYIQQPPSTSKISKGATPLPYSLPITSLFSPQTTNRSTYSGWTTSNLLPPLTHAHEPITPHSLALPNPASQALHAPQPQHNQYQRQNQLQQAHLATPLPARQTQHQTQAQQPGYLPTPLPLFQTTGDQAALWYQYQGQGQDQGQGPAENLRHGFQGGEMLEPRGMYPEIDEKGDVVER